MSAFRLKFAKASLDKLLRLKRVASPRILFPDLPQEHIERLTGVMQGKPCTVWDSDSEGLSVLIAMGPEHKPYPTLTLRATFYEPRRPSAARYQRLGRWPSEIEDVERARQMARDIRNRASAGEAVSREAKAEAEKQAAAAQALAEADLLDVMVDRYVKYKRAKQVRTWREIERLLETYVLREWAGRDVRSIAKRDVMSLLERISAGQIERQGRMLGTPSTSSAVYAQLAAFFRWYRATQEDAFAPPIDAMMRIGKPQAREKVLSDAELRALWPLWNDSVYGRLCQSALLTAQRFRKTGQMRRSELHEHFLHGGVSLRNVWCPSQVGEAKNKHASIVPLSDFAVHIITSLPVVDGSDFVFTRDGRPFSQFHRSHARVDAALKQQGTVVEWFQGRDLRRTARTLLSRAGVPLDVAEHCLGHSLGGPIRQTYDRWGFLREKQVAFQKLADLVQEIVNGEKAGRRRRR